MELIYQNNWFCTVKDFHTADLVAETVLVGTDIEATGRLTIDKKTFVIKDAGWEIIRSPGSALNGSGPVHGLIGTKAYFNAGAILRRAVDGSAGGLVRELLAECVRGVIQAETFLYRERGYLTPQAYGEYWEKSYRNSCRYYSNLSRISLRWPDYVCKIRPCDNYFNRSKIYSIYKRPGGMRAIGIISDTFHEISVSMDLRGEGLVTGCSGSFLRAPDLVCIENISLLEQFQGTVFPGCHKKEIARVIGGAQGCVHMVDLLSDMEKTTTYVLSSSF